MKTTIKLNLSIAVLITSIFIGSAFASAPDFFKKDKSDDKNYVSFEGKVVDAKTSEALIFASLTLEGTNIATVSNSEGDFIIKIPKDKLSGNIKVSYMGYKNISLPLSELKESRKNTIKLTIETVKLTEINIFPNSPGLLIDKVIQNKNKNYQNEPVIMRSFYRETVKKRRSYISLSEAVVDVYKQPYWSIRNDAVKLFKGRKSEDVAKVDTLLFKLQGGPYSTLMLDLIREPYLILDDEVRDKYIYTYENITRVDGELNYVISFKQHEYINTPLFYGKFYINVDNFAISSAFFSLNTENKREASAMFIKRKPLGASVYPTAANYLVKYNQKDNKWYYSYSRGEVSFKVNWKKKLFNTMYSTMVEMAVTDWKVADEKTFKGSERMKTTVILNEEVSSFADKDFWGELNTIEPEKSIESAIKKISKSIDK